MFCEYLMVFSEKLASRYRELKQEVPECLLLMQVGTDRA